MQTQTSVLKTVGDLAAELAVSTIEAQRAIARSRVKATRMGEDGPWRILSDEIERYVAAGAMGLRLPEFDPFGASDWFTPSLNYLAESFSTALMEAAEEQVPSDDKLRAKFAADPKSESITIDIKPTGAVAQVLGRPVPVSAFTPADANDVNSRFSTWADLFAVDLLRTLARVAVYKRDVTANGLATLYDSPETYTTITDEAYTGAQKRRVAFSRRLSLTGPAFGPIPVDRRATFILSLADIFSPANKTRLIALAF